MSISKLWKYRAAITIDHTKVAANQTNFPIALVWTGAAGSSNFPSDPLDADGSYPAKSDGSDIRFSSDIYGMTELPFEIVQWTPDNNTANARAEIHCKPAALSSTVDDIIYVFWGNAAAAAYAVGDTYGRNAVWTNGHIWVSHCNENAGSTMVDSTGGKDAAYKAALPSRQTTGPMKSSQRFSFVANSWAYIRAYAALGFPSSADMTSMAVMVRNTSNVYQGIFQKNDGDASPGNLAWGWYASTQPTSGRESQAFRGNFGGVGKSSIDTTGTTSAVNFNHLCVVYNHTNVKNYIDASEETILTTGGDLDSTTYDSMEIGNWNGNPGSDQVQGDIDELRISNVARSSTWITTQKNNWLAANTFASAGATQTIPRADFAQFFALH
jgi:hypothetical protein